ncbi:hypothetical protein [Alicyclobacillus shizuokensis]|uniref:hypothetical protein n=1 Tax=Alicyclobacillus shizuokensis TaxID=392014 RepID=UPI0008298FAF|nr:hypothetical protein [Alicyclobacillus shizuokensis]
MLAFEELKEYCVITPHGSPFLSGYRVATYLDGSLDAVIECSFLQDVVKTVSALRSQGYRLRVAVA